MCYRGIYITFPLPRGGGNMKIKAWGKRIKGKREKEKRRKRIGRGRKTGKKGKRIKTKDDHDLIISYYSVMHIFIISFF